MCVPDTDAVGEPVREFVTVPDGDEEIDDVAEEVMEWLAHAVTLVVTRGDAESEAVTHAEPLNETVFEAERDRVSVTEDEGQELVVCETRGDADVDAVPHEDCETLGDADVDAVPHEDRDTVETGDALM